MTQPHFDRQRAAKLMQELGVAALILVQPESIHYATGAFAGVATLWRRAGAAAVVVPADPNAPLAAVVGDLQAASFRSASGIDDTRSHPIWVETTHAAGEGSAAARIAAHDHHRPPGFQRPATFNPRLMLAQLRDILVERGLDRAPLGLELGFVSVADMQTFTTALPDVRWRDASPLVACLRMIKHPLEIASLRLAATLTTAGLAHALGALREGIDAATIGDLWRGKVEEEAQRLPLKQSLSSWAYIAVGPDGFAPGSPAQRGDVVKIDVGAVVGGYSADVARTAVIGKASSAQREIYDALQNALEAALAVLAPGQPLKHAHAAATKVMHSAGFASFSRGHFGHSLGADVFNEEWPFIAADCDVLLEPNMVIAVEAPYYVRGIGGFIIEDQFLVTENGLELMSPLSRDLLEIE